MLTNMNGITNNKVYKQNITALKKNYPELAVKIKSTQFTNRYSLDESKTGLINIYINKLGKYYYDQQDPLRDAKDQINVLEIRNSKIALCLGFGLGYEVQYFAEQVAHHTNTEYIIIVEKDVELFKIALAVKNYVPMIENKRINLAIGLNSDELFPYFVNHFRYGKKIYYLKAIKPVYHLSSFIFGKEYYQKALQTLREAGTYSLDFFGNSPEDSLIGVENMLDNINEIIGNPGINLLYEKFKKKPAIIVATGPSLDKNKHLLKGLEDKALIISVDASLRILVEMGVKPHLVTSLERMEPTVKLIKGFRQEEVKDVYYAACPVVMKENYQVYPGPRIIVYRNFGHFKWLGIDRGILDIKQSAGNMAFKLAQVLGCAPIILIGQDLAYSRDGEITHASGTTYGSKQKHVAPARRETLKVPGNDGKPILTNKVWNMFRQGYELDIKEYSGECINSTEGGAYINGTIVMPFKEAIKKYIKVSFNPLPIIQNTLKAFTQDDVEADYHYVLNTINKTIDELEQIGRYCNNALDIIDNSSSKLVDIANGKGINDDLDLTKMEKEVMNSKREILKMQDTLHMFLMHIIQSFHIKFEIDLHAIPNKYNDNDRIIASVLLLHRRWYAVIHDIVGICIASLEKARDDTKELGKMGLRT